MLDGRHDEPVCICPEHLLHGGDGRPVCYDPEKRVPATPELKAFYDDLDAVDFMPLPKPGCEPQVLHALLHSGLVTADHPFLLPVCEYPHCGAVFADEPFGGETVRLVFDRDFRRGVRYGLAHEQPCPLLPTLWAAYGVNADTLVRCWSQRYGVANRLRALGEDDLADRLAYEE